MNKRFSPEARALIAQSASLSPEATEIVSRLLSTSASSESLEVENANLLSAIQELASKHGIDLDTDSSTVITNRLLKLIISMEKKAQALAETVSPFFDSESFDESDDQSDFDESEMEDDLRLADVKEKFSQYLLAVKFSDVILQYSVRGMWDSFKPKYRSVFANMLIDEAEKNDTNYPDFWQEYL